MVVSYRVYRSFNVYCSTNVPNIPNSAVCGEKKLRPEDPFENLDDV